MDNYDAVVVGAGPNGLAAAIVIARAGLSVAVFEGGDSVGGGTRTDELTVPGFHHDVCSAIHPLHQSPAFRSFPLAEFGVDWVYAPVELAHPLDGGRAVALSHDVNETASQFPDDSDTYRKAFDFYARHADELFAQTLRPLVNVPSTPISLARFGLPALLSAKAYVRRYQSSEARSLFLGVAAHNVTSLTKPASAAVALALMTAAHRYRWPMARGGSHTITKAMADYLESMGGVLHLGNQITDLSDLPPSRLKLLSVPPPALAALAGDRLSGDERKKLNAWRFGPGVFKVDWALDGPVPWDSPTVREAGTVHVVGDSDEVMESEDAMWNDRHAERPYVLFAQQSLFDETRAPTGKQTGWAYCHVPHGSTVDMTDAIESQIERFAPGFRDLIIGRHTMSSEDYERYNSNYVGGDIGSGSFTLKQILARPRFGPNPYKTSLDGVFLCGSSTAPGAGVHGMAGWNAAHAALKSIGMNADNS